MVFELTQNVDTAQQSMIEKATEMSAVDRHRTSYEVLRYHKGTLDGGGVFTVADGFPERLRQLRQQRGFLQAALAEKVGLHQNQIGRYERGTSQPSGDALKRLADVLGVSADYLLEGATKDAAKADFDDRELLRMFKEIEGFEPHDKDVVKTLIDAFIKKKQFLAIAIQ